MKKIISYIGVVLLITILLPTVIVRTFKFVPRGNSVVGESLEEERPIVNDSKEVIQPPVVSNYKYEKIKVYNRTKEEVEELDLEEYVKGVVAAEMPAAFHIEALKAQAIAARTYAISRGIKYPEGHPSHPLAGVCDGIHCQAYWSFETLSEMHGESWIEDFWPKIEEAVNSTKNLGIFYNGEIIEPLYHSTSGGQTEDVKDVFSIEQPYLKSVSSPNEEGAPKYRNVTTLTIEEFITKIKLKYPNANINQENIAEKIKLVDKSTTGRVKKIAIDQNVLEGSAMRDLFALNSTNFTIALDKKLNLIEIETYGYGHGVGMSQWGANGMGKAGSTAFEILKHYYTGVDVKYIE